MFATEDKFFFAFKLEATTASGTARRRRGSLVIEMRGAHAGMNNKQHTKNFAQSDDALILDQPVTRIGLKILATMLHTSEESVMRRAD